MPKKIYVITGSSGEYSDRTDWNICATFDEEHANSITDKLRRLSVFNSEFKKRVYNEFEVPYNEAHKEAITRPTRIKPKVSREFRFAMEQCAHGKGTPEDKAILKKLQTEHIRQCEEYTKEYNKICDVYLSAIKVMLVAKEEWEKQNYHPPAELLEVSQYCSDAYDTRYDYEEIDICETPLD